MAFAAAIPAIMGAVGAGAQTAGAFAGQKGQEVKYAVSSEKMARSQAQMQAFVDAMMTGQMAYAGYKGGNVGSYMPGTTNIQYTKGTPMVTRNGGIGPQPDIVQTNFALSPALQQAYNQIKSMVSYGTTGQMDQATEQANAQMRSNAQMLAERGVYGGQQVQMEQQVRDNLIRSILGAQRQGAQQTAQYGAGLWENQYQDAMKMMQFLASGGTASSSGGGGTNMAAGLQALGQGLYNTAGALQQQPSTSYPQVVAPEYGSSFVQQSPWNQSYFGGNQPQIQSPYAMGSYDLTQQAQWKP